MNESRKSGNRTVKSETKLQLVQLKEIRVDKMKVGKV